MFLFGKTEDDEWCITLDGKLFSLIDEPYFCFSYHPEFEIRATLHKFGGSYVKKYFKDTVEKYEKAGLIQEANELVCMSFPIDVEELNKCIEITGYIAKVYENYMERHKEYQEKSNGMASV